MTTTFRLVGWDIDDDGCRNLIELKEIDLEGNPFKKNGKLFSWIRDFFEKFSSLDLGPNCNLHWQLQIRKMDKYGFDQYVPFRTNGDYNV